MPNMDPKKCPMPSQEPNVRNKNFKEVALGYTEEMAVNEAKRCLQCKNHPCRSGCPVEIDIPGFIKHVAEGDFEAAYNVIAQSSALPAVCGRVCPQEHQCEGKCVRGIKGEAVGIGRLERFVADWYRNNVHTKPTAPAPNGHKVAVIGAGPSGLTVAGDLAKLGYKVTVYEALHVAGGVLMYGIPEFRLPKAIVQQEIDGLKKMGVDFECNMVIGKVLTIDELMDEYGYEAVFVGSGAGLPRFMGIPGESLKGVYSANEFLTRSNLMKAYLPTSKTPIRTGKKVAVVGGGLPIGAVLMNEKVAEGMGPGTHGSTFGGNPVVCAGANVVVDRMDQSFLANVSERAVQLRAGLAKLPMVKNLSGIGLMVGIAFDDGIKAADVRAACEKAGLLVLTAKTRLRLLPPLILTADDVDAALAILRSVLEKCV